MLSHLIIKNYALIKNLEIDPTQGLNIITGETGAGKSIMLGAVGLLMGNRADVKTLFDETEKCVVEGTFEIKYLDFKYFFEENDLDYDDTCVIRREIAPTGKSRAFVNDSPVNLDILKNLGQLLIDVHSQHETISLGNNVFQINLIDSFAQNSNILSEYKIAFSNFKKADLALIKLQNKASELKKEYDYNLFLLNELADANLENIDQKAIEEELNLLENAEELKKTLGTSFQCLK